MTEQQIHTQELYDPLVSGGVDYFCGVPDSITGPFSHFLEDNAKDNHVIAANEGNAIGLAIGYNAATNRIPLVYMQNSGLNNAIDPLASLADRSVFGIPMLLLIGWRGQPGINDEVHHTRQGEITPDLLQNLQIPFASLLRDPHGVSNQVQQTIRNADNQQTPQALVIEQGTFVEYHSTEAHATKDQMSREEAVDAIIEGLDDDAVVVSGIGKLSRELYELRDRRDENHDSDLLVVGGMGHASSIALGIATQRPDKKVFCLDGDGSTIMHLGALATIGNLQPQNFFHIVFNNGAHDSVGGQPTASKEIDLAAIALACGYNQVAKQSNLENLTEDVIGLQQGIGPTFLEVKVRGGARANLTRPNIQPADNKTAFTTFLG